MLLSVSAGAAALLQAASRPVCDVPTGLRRQSHGAGRRCSSGLWPLRAEASGPRFASAALWTATTSSNRTCCTACVSVCTGLTQWEQASSCRWFLTVIVLELIISMCCRLGCRAATTLRPRQQSPPAARHWVTRRRRWCQPLGRTSRPDSGPQQVREEQHPWGYAEAAAALVAAVRHQAPPGASGTCTGVHAHSGNPMLLVRTICRYAHI